LVLAAVDWCEIRNGAYDQWREALAAAAGTSRERVLVSSLHQHDAPVVDREAQQFLNEVGLENELYDEQFHAQCLTRVAEAVKQSLSQSRPCTHIGVGQAQVEDVASNRRVVHADGHVAFDRGSSSGGNVFMRDAPVGTIDPQLKTISFWNGDEPLLALHAYATHPMSYYGAGEVSADFVGLARRRRFQDNPRVAQIYVSGCSGDVTAGKYNDGAPAMRAELADRLYQAMLQSWHNTQRHPLEHVQFRLAALDLPFREGPDYAAEHLRRTLHDESAAVRERILAAMALSSRARVERGQAIDMPCIDLGAAQIVLFPAEAFVEYQLQAQRLRPDSFVLCIGYGECWPGYIPTAAAFADHFRDVWLWVAEDCEPRVQEALAKVLR
jgi:hypothetical protein